MDREYYHAILYFKNGNAVPLYVFQFKETIKYGTVWDYFVDLVLPEHDIFDDLQLIVIIPLN